MRIDLELQQRQFGVPTCFLFSALLDLPYQATYLVFQYRLKGFVSPQRQPGWVPGPGRLPLPIASAFTNHIYGSDLAAEFELFSGKNKHQREENDRAHQSHLFLTIGLQLFRCAAS